MAENLEVQQEELAALEAIYNEDCVVDQDLRCCQVG